VNSDHIGHIFEANPKKRGHCYRENASPSNLQEGKTMCSSRGTKVNQSQYRSTGSCRTGRTGKGNWTGLNIAAMVLSFVFFWPIGLVVLFWILAGRDVTELPAAIMRKWNDFRGSSHSFTIHSGNAVFNDFQQTQYDRINEIKHEIKMRAERFKEFQSEAQRRADQDEFNRFMANSPGSVDR